MRQAITYTYTYDGKVIRHHMASLYDNELIALIFCRKAKFYIET